MTAWGERGGNGGKTKAWVVVLWRRRSRRSRRRRRSGWVAVDMRALECFLLGLPHPAFFFPSLALSLALCGGLVVSVGGVVCGGCKASE